MTPEFTVFFKKAFNIQITNEIIRGNILDSIHNSNSSERNQLAKATIGIGDSKVRLAQASLVIAGYNIGEYGAHGVDGKLGTLTIQAVKDFQQAVGLKPNGDLNAPTMFALDFITKKGFSRSEIEFIGKGTHDPAKQKKEVGGNDYFDELIGHVLNVEGGFVDHPNDVGGATNKGITLNTFKLGAKEYLGIEPTLENLKNLTIKQAKTLYRKMYWEPIDGSQIKDKQVAHIMFDMAVNSGVKTTVKYMQKTLNQIGNSLDVDGMMGPKTLNAINNANSEKLFNDFKKVRINLYKSIIAKDPTQKVFEKGWMNRINSFIYKN